VTGPTGAAGATGATGATGPAGAGAMSIFSYTLAANTAGGNATSGAWGVRPLNTTVVNDISGCSISSNQITLPAGTYVLRGWGLFYGGINRNRTAFYNTTDSAFTVLSASMTGVTTGTAGNQSSTVSLINGYFTIAASKVFEFQYRVASTQNTSGLGLVSNLDSKDELYSYIELTKVA
jgi:hypothetical protein